MIRNLLPKLNQTQKTILFVIFLFLAGASYLFSVDSRYNDPRYNNDWFALSFSEPQSDNFDFTVENFSSQPDFQWEILVEKEKVSDGFAHIAPRSKKDIRIKADPQAAGKITIRVSSQNETQEIYKNIK